MTQWTESIPVPSGTSNTQLLPLPGSGPKVQGWGCQDRVQACHLGTVIPTCMTPTLETPTFSSPHGQPLHNIPHDVLLSSLQDTCGLSVATQLSSLRAGGAGSGNQAHSFISLLGLRPGKPVAVANPWRELTGAQG